MVEIIKKYSGVFNWHPTEETDGGGGACQIIIKDYDAGTETVVFTGKDYSEEEYK